MGVRVSEMHSVPFTVQCCQLSFFVVKFCFDFQFKTAKLEVFPRLSFCKNTQFPCSIV